MYCGALQLLYLICTCGIATAVDSILSGCPASLALIAYLFTCQSGSLNTMLCMKAPHHVTLMLRS